MKHHILKVHANGVSDQRGKFFPFRITTADLAAKNTARYFIDAVNFNAINEGDVAHAHLTVQWWQLGVSTTISTNLALGKVDVITSSLAQQVHVGVLTDLGTAVDLTTAGAVGDIFIRYAEVEEYPGEYGA